MLGIYPDTDYVDVMDSRDEDLRRSNVLACKIA